MRAAAIILAGGRSSRFGRDKSLLTWRGGLIMEELVRQCRPLFDEILIVSNAEGKFPIPGVRELTDRWPGMGPLGGIHAGLEEARFETTFVTACDMPCFHAGLAGRLLELSGAWEAAVPRDGERIQPLFAMLRRSAALPAAEKLLGENRRTLRWLYDSLRTCYLDREAWPPSPQWPAEDLFFNINYPEDYERLRSQGEEKEVGRT